MYRVEGTRDDPCLPQYSKAAEGCASESLESLHHLQPSAATAFGPLSALSGGACAARVSLVSLSRAPFGSPRLVSAKSLGQPCGARLTQRQYLTNIRQDALAKLELE